VRNRRALLLAIAMCAVIPPLLARAAAGFFTPLVAFTFGVAASYAVAAISLNILMGYAGQISLGHAAFLGIGAFTSGLLTAKGAEVPYFVGIAGAAVVGGTFAFALGLPALRLRGLYLAIVTIGFVFMVEQSLFRWKPLTGGSAGLGVPRPRMGSFVFARHGDYLALALLILIGAWVLDVNVVRTKLGRAFHAIRWDESVAQAFGVDVARYKLLAFVLAGALGGVSGAMFGHLIGFVGVDSFSFDESLLLVVIVVVGGLGSRSGVVVAAGVFTALPRLLTWLSGWEYVVGPLLLIDVVARHPGGLAQAVREARQRAGAKRARAGLDDAGTEDTPARPALPRPVAVHDRPEVVAGAPLLDVRDLSVRFGGLQALSEVSLTVPKGKIVGLIGPNGAGKTTLFNAISGFVRPQAGVVRFLGAEIQHRSPHERVQLGIGRTFQLIGLAKNLSVLENFLLAQHPLAGYRTVAALGYLPSVRRTERSLRDGATAAIEALGFERFRDTPVSNLSHGQQRLVELGCALITGPELLLLDEPSAGMSPAATESLAERLRELRDRLDRTVLLIEHNIPLVLDVCDEIAVLNFGQLLARGTTEEIAREPAVLGAYFGEAVPA
jgi:branched-chain amino acid transport system permease protein